MIMFTIQVLVVGLKHYLFFREFIQLVSRFVSQKPLEMIGVHCTHGFNRTGFLLVSYMVEHLDCSVQAAINEFSRMRYLNVVVKLVHKKKPGSTTAS